MGYRGKVVQQEQARAMRAEGMTLVEIAEALGVAKSSVSLWVRDVVFTPRPRQRPTFVAPNRLHIAKLAEIEACDGEGRERIGVLSDDAFLAAGAALYAGEGTKRDGQVCFANSDAAMMRFFAAWFRRYFEIDEARLRVRVYLHQGLDLDAAHAHWSDVTGVPLEQFRAPYRAEADPTIRSNKHEHGCAYLLYACSRTHRRIMGLVRALLSSEALPG
jgi:transcriptional regulator with XRE-family HTH domain